MAQLAYRVFYMLDTHGIFIGYFIEKHIWFHLAAKTVQLFSAVLFVYLGLFVFFKYNIDLDMTIGLVAIVLAVDVLYFTKPVYFGFIATKAIRPCFIMSINSFRKAVVILLMLKAFSSYAQTPDFVVYFTSGKAFKIINNKAAALKEKDKLFFFRSNKCIAKRPGIACL